MSYANDWGESPAPNENPYAAPVSMIEDDYGAEYKPWAHRALATRVQRLAASFIDGFAYAVVAIPWIVVMILVETNSNNDALFFILGAIGGVLVLALLIYNLMRLHAHQQTLGKQLIGIQIIRADLQTPVTLGRIIGLRVLPVAFLGSIPCIGSIIQFVNPLMIFQESQQCLHDTFADTNVVVYEA